jgi:hypothetical protein
MLSTNQITVLTSLAQSWPANLAISIRDGVVEDLQSHPLREEITAFENRQRCSLPYFRPTSNEITWVSTARDADELQSVIQDLRCWLLPSFAWQDSAGWLVTEPTPTVGVGSLILDMSPAGYCRWKSRPANFNQVVEKFSRMRALEHARPQHVTVRVPSLLEARQQFVSALVSGDQSAAEGIISVIDRNKLDTPDNTLFMRVRCWDRFGQIDRIVRGRELEHLRHLRIPHRIRLCILRAFHESFLKEQEDHSDADAAIESYRLDVHDRLSGMIRLCQTKDGQFVLRLLAYRAAVMQDFAEARRLAESGDDEFVATVLTPLLSKSPTETPIDEQFFEARKRQDWAEVQRLGIQLLDQGDEYASILWKSLEFSINPELEATLLAYEKLLTAGIDVQQPNIPQTWSEWFASLTENHPTQFQAFLDNRQTADLDRLLPSEIASLHEVLERFCVEAPFETDCQIRQWLLSGLPEFMEDFVVEPNFPSDNLADIYLDLFRLWSAIKRGSAYPPDGQVLLNLAEGVWQFRPAVETEIVNVLRGWWENRPVRALLPFLLGIVDLLDHLGSEGQCESFWVVGAEFLRHNQQALTPGERALWRHIGGRIGYDESILDEYLPVPAAETDVDPLQQANLRKVAIVSMRERQAREAAAMISERSNAEIVIVSDKVAGSATDNAITADVILFVWAATSHAVFRAFDGMDRERLVYVQGTGAASIVLALERWLAAQMEIVHE